MPPIAAERLQYGGEMRREEAMQPSCSVEERHLSDVLRDGLLLALTSDHSTPRFARDMVFLR